MQNMYHHLCVYVVYIVFHPSSMCFSQDKREILPLGHSLSVHTSLAHIKSHESFFNPYMELGAGQKGGKSMRKDHAQLSEQWRVHSAGDCGGERQRWQSNRSSSHPDGNVRTWRHRLQILMYSSSFAPYLTTLQIVQSSLVFLTLWWKFFLEEANGNR